MTTPWVPPYFGSYDHLLEELMHNPFLGSFVPPPRLHADALYASKGNHQNPEPNPWRNDPWPNPWRNSAVSYLASLVGLRQLAGSIKNPALSNQISASIAVRLGEFLDDYCGNGKGPWPLPGPPPWIYSLASQLVATANESPAGAFREGLMEIAGQVVERAYAGAALAQTATR